MGDKPSVCLIYSEITPYRLALFEVLSKKIDIQVNFCITKSKKRFWSGSAEGYSFKYRILKFFSIGPMIINFILPVTLIRDQALVYIIDDDPRLILSKIMTFIIAKLKRRPIIIWSESISEPIFGKVKNFIYTVILSGFNLIIYHNSNAYLASGQKTADYFIKKRVAKERIYIGTQGLSKTELLGQLQINRDEAKKQLGVANKKIVLFVGYLTKRKGIFELVDTFIRMNHDGVVLVIAGAGKAEKQLKKIVGGKDNILFTGYVEGKEKAIYYAIADVFVLPTFIDPWGLVIMEAMMFGLPVITTTKAGASELIQGNGIIIEPGDSKALEKAITFILDNDKQRHKMGQFSLEIIKDYTVERAADTFIEAISFCLNKSRATKNYGSITIKFR